MSLKNNRYQKEHKRQIYRNFNDAPSNVDIRQSVVDLRRIYPEMTNEKFATWYQKRYRVDSRLVLKILSESPVN